MNKYKKSIIIILGIVILFVALYFGFIKIISPAILKYQQNQSQEVWKNAQSIIGSDQAFSYKVVANAKEESKDKYAQEITGNFVNNQKLRGNYKIQNEQKTIEKEFILIDNIVYSKEGERKDKWFVWNKDNYAEAIYYVPADILKSVDQEKVSFVRKDGKSFVFECYLKSQPSVYGPSVGNILVTINEKTNLVTEVKYERRQGALDIATTIIYSDYGKQIEIVSPPDDQIAK